MPIYDYNCDKCKTTKEVLQKLNDHVEVKCDKCNKVLTREFPTPSFMIDIDLW